MNLVLLARCFCFLFFLLLLFLIESYLVYYSPGFRFKTRNCLRHLSDPYKRFSPFSVISKYAYLTLDVNMILLGFRYWQWWPHLFSFLLLSRIKIFLFFFWCIFFPFEKYNNIFLCSRIKQNFFVLPVIWETTDASWCQTRTRRRIFMDCYPPVRSWLKYFS